MKSILITLALLLIPICFFGQSYTDWDEHDIVQIYEKIELEDETLNEDGEEIEFILSKTKLKQGDYEIEIGDKINSNIYQINGADLYLKFRFNPFLFKWDEGILEWNGYSGIFYEQP